MTKRRRTMSKLIVLVLVCAPLLCAADQPTMQKIVPLKAGDGVDVFATVRDLMHDQVSVKMYQNNIVLSGSAEGVAAAEQLIKNLESMASHTRDVELTGYIILASMEPNAGGGSTPAELEPVLKQFRTLLNYKSFRVLDTVLLRAKENSEAQAQGFLPLPNAEPPGASDTFSFRKATVSDDVVHLTNLRLFAGVAYTTGKGEASMRQVNLQTDADVKIGQKVAIGKASVDAAGDAL